MVRLIESRADELRHAGVENHEALVTVLLDKHHTCYERTALCHDGTAQLEVQLLTFTQMQMPSKSVEERLERSHRTGIRMLVVHTQATTHINHLEVHIAAIEEVEQLIDALAKHAIRLHESDL